MDIVRHHNLTRMQFNRPSPFQIVNGEIFGVGVKEIRFYDLYDNQILYPNSNEPFKVKVLVANATKEKQSRVLKMYLNDNETAPFINESIDNIAAESTFEYTYSVEAFDWQAFDVLNFKMI